MASTCNDMIGSVFDRTGEVLESSSSYRSTGDQHRDASLHRAIDSHLIISVADADGKLVRVNDNFLAITGYRREELIGKDFKLLSAGAHPEGFWRDMWTAISGGEEWRHRFCNRRKDGDRFWVDATISPSRGEKGDIEEYVSVWTDITELYEERNELERLVRNTDAMSEIARVGSWEYDLISGEFTWSRVTRLIHEASDDYEPGIESALAFYCEGESRDRILSLVDQASRSGGMWDDEFEITTAKGRRIWVRSYGKAEMLDGQCVKLYGAFQDIDRRKRAMLELEKKSESLERAQKRLDMATRASGVGVWDWHVLEDRLEWGEGMFSLYKLGKDEFDGTSKIWFELLHPEDRTRAERELSEAMLGENDLDTSYRFVLKDGTLRYIRVQAIVIRSESGEPVRMLGTNWDVTESVKANEALIELANKAESANRAKSEFLANMSHEIRTPMNGVIGMTSMLLDSESLSDQHREFAEVAMSCGEELLGLIDGILDLSKIESGSMQLASSAFHLKDLVNAFSEQFRLRAREKSLRFECDMKDAIPDVVRGDSIRLKQVLANLLGNAFKFTERGRVRMRVALDRYQDDGVFVKFSVEDTGIGIDPANKAGLFDKFTQADASTTRKYGGSGLGLAISKQIVDLMGGEMGLESEAGKGSLFWFTAWFESDESGIEPVVEPVGTGSKKRNLGKRLLLVEDNPVNRMVARGILNAMGCEVEIACDGVEALQFLESETCDAIFMDLHMPRMDGIEATRRIRKREAELGTEPLPIIALTARVQVEDRETCFEVGMNDFLSKPITPSAVSKALDKIALAK